MYLLMFSVRLLSSFFSKRYLTTFGPLADLFVLDLPSFAPSVKSSAIPSESPSFISPVPSYIPSSEHSNIPSAAPNASPSLALSAIPSNVKSDQPSIDPSSHPTAVPSIKPIDQPSFDPSGELLYTRYAFVVYAIILCFYRLLCYSFEVLT